MGCRVLLALLVLHRAKLLASNQSILALGRSPRQGLGAVAPVKSPFPGERGQGDRDSKLEVCFKNRFFLQAETLYSVINIIIIYSRPLRKAEVSTNASQGRNLRRHIAAKVGIWGGTLPQEILWQTRNCTRKKDFQAVWSAPPQVTHSARP